MREYPKYKKVLFCTDFSENSDYAFDFAYGIAKRDKGLLYMLHVIPRNPHQAYAEGYIPYEDLARIQKSVEEYVVESFQRHYIKNIEDGVHFETVIKAGREDEEILEFANKEKVDIIVIGTHGRTGIEHVFFGSVAEKILRGSPFPVFIIPCKKKFLRD
ncbi:MAG: universal stress protein [Thermodesulfobacteriota bacterium]